MILSSDSCICVGSHPAMSMPSSFGAAHPRVRLATRVTGTSTPGFLVPPMSGSGVPTITHDEAIDVALCFGWIDGQLKKLDPTSRVVRFSPRRPKSVWSQRNRDRVARLVAQREMTPLGLAQVEAAKADGRWDAAYAPPSEAVLPEAVAQRLAADATTKAFAATLSRQNVMAIAFRYANAKRDETKARFVDKVLAMLKRGETLYPQAAPKTKANAKTAPRAAKARAPKGPR